MKHLFTLILIAISISVQAQSDSTAILDISSTDKGILIPRMTSTNRQAIEGPAIGLMVYDSTVSAFYYYNGIGWLELLAENTSLITDTDNDTKIQVEETADEDIIRFDMAGTEFFRMGSGRLEVLNTGQSVFIGENAGSNDNLTNNKSVFIGYYTGSANTSGTSNTAIGANAFEKNTTGIQNSVNGSRALLNNTTGSRNTATGTNALRENINGNFNTAFGNASLNANTTGNGNVAVGYDALFQNKTGNYNIAIGYSATTSGISLNNATAIGYQAKVATSNSLILGGAGANAVNVGIGTDSPTELLTLAGVSGTDGIFFPDSTLQTTAFTGNDVITDADNDTKIQVEETTDEDIIRFDIAGTEFFKMNSGRLEVLNTGRSVFLGSGAGASDDLTFNENTFVGEDVGTSTTSGNQNTAIGSLALEDNETGSQNTAIGAQALDNNSGGSNNTAVGYDANVQSGNLSNATAIGYQAKVATSNSLVLGGIGVNAVKVGIGTTSPTELLTLSGISGTDGILFPDNTLQTTAFTGSDVITDADNDTKIQVEETADEDVIRFDTDSTQRMIINKNGFVGVGPSNPTANLTVIGTATSNTEIVHFSNSNNSKKAIVSLSNSGAGQLVLLDGSNNTDVLLSASNNSYFNAANLGVGNNNPQERLHITGKIRMEDGNQGIGKVMTSNAVGVASWQTISTDMITDTDNDTKIQVEETSDEDVIRFDLGGTEYFKMINGRFEIINTGSSVFIGMDAGGNDDLGANLNTYIGTSTGGSNVSGENNTMIGFESGAFNLGSGNVFIGSRAGRDTENISNRLYIENTSTFSPLIYGEFDNDLVRVNGDLDITENLEVTGTTTVGNTGTALSYIIKVNVSKNVGSISSDNMLNVDFNVPGAETFSSVIVSPSADLPNQVFIGQTRVQSPNTVRVRFHNESNSSKDPVNMVYYITVIK